MAEPLPAIETVAEPLSPEPVAEPAAAQPIFVYKKDDGSLKKKKPRRWVRRVLIGLSVVTLVLAGWFGLTLWNAAHKIIGKSNGHAPGLGKNVSTTQLKGEGDGRVNILMLGIGGGDHEGASLSDTIMVISLDPKTKDVAMLSVPRDLYVKIKTGEYGKINQANADGGPTLAKQVVQTVLGVPIHYYLQVDFSGFKQAVDAVGGIDLTVAEALSDPEYPCDNDQYRSCGYYQPAGQFHMNGTQALKYARCRKGTCGLDFGRAARQQQVLVALRQKALQISTLTNPVKLTALINAVGDHVKTDLQLNEIEELASIAKDVDPSKIVNKVLNTDADNYLVFGPDSLGAGSVEIPKAGLFDYSAIQDFVKNIFVDHYITGENARIEVQNGSGVAGVGAKVVASLQAAHYNVGQAVTADSVTAKTVIYDYTGGKKSYTINYLEKRFGVKAQKVAAPSASPGTVTPEIRIIIGSDYKTTSQN